MTATMHKTPAARAPAVGESRGFSDAETRARRDVVARSGPSVAAGAVALGLLLYMAFDSGAYFPAVYLRAAWIAFAALTVLLLVRPPHYLIGTHALLAAGALAALTAWTALSSDWSLAPGTALEAMQRAVLSALTPRRGRLAATFAVVAGGSVIAIARLRAYPALVDDPSAGSGQVSSGHAFGPQLLALLAAVAVLHGYLDRVRGALAARL